MPFSRTSALPLAGGALALALFSLAAPRPAAAFFSAEPPGEETSRKELKKEISTISVGIEATADELARLANQSVPKSLYKGAAGTSGISAEITRNGSIGVSAADNFVHLAVPISLSMSYKMFKTPAISLTLRFKMRVGVTPDWKVSGEVYYTGISDLLAEEVGVGPVKIRPRSIVEGATQPVQRVLADLLVRRLNEKYPLKAEVEKAWRAARKPVLVDRNYHAWLKLSPQEVSLFPMVAQSNRIRMSFGLKSLAEVVVGPEPEATPPAPLPSLKLVDGTDRTFRLAVNTDLYYKDLLAALSPLLLDKNLGSDGKNIVLKSLDMYGNGDKLVVRVETSGDLEGTFFLNCRPCFDPEKKLFSVEDVDFDMNSKSILLNVGDWFLHGVIRSKIKEKLNVDMSDRLEKARLQAQQALSQVKLADSVFLRGTVQTLKFRDVAVQKDRLSVQVYAEGETGIAFR